MERSKPGWFGRHVSTYQQANKQQAEVVLLGDSIVANLARFSDVWDQHLAPLNVTNCGIPGDHVLNVL